MTADAAVLCCCAVADECCDFTAVTMSIASATAEFDILYTDINGQPKRRFTSAQLDQGIWVPTPITLSSNLRGPIVLDRKGAGASDPGFGTLGRCGYQKQFSVPSNLSFYGWSGNIITVDAGLPADAQNSIVSQGNARIGAGPHYVQYFIRPFRLNGWNQTDGPWGFEAGLVCGQIGIGVVQGWPFNGCPIGSDFAPIDMAGGFTYYRGKVRVGGSPYGSLFNLTPPNYDAQDAINAASSYGLADGFQVSIQ